MVKTKQILALQFVVGFIALVPILVGLRCIFIGPDGVSPSLSVSFKTDRYPMAVDSHFRYISGCLVAIGALLLRSLPNIDRNGSDLRRVSFFIFIGGLARLWGLFAIGMDFNTVITTIFELVLPPVVCYWQKRIQENTIANTRKPQ